MVVHTENRGGSTLHKGFAVFTNDPGKPKIHLKVSGKVKGYIAVEPGYVRLTGQVGQPIQQTVTLTPQQGHPFKIKEIQAQTNEFVSYQLSPKDEKAPEAGYRLLVINTKSETGNYHDTLIIRTDNPHKPTLRIPVYGRIFAPQPLPAGGSGK